MDEITVMASRFKQQCLALLDNVSATKVPIVVTKHGKPIARVVPIEADRQRKPLKGSVKILAATDEELYSTGESWDAEETAVR